MLGQRRSQSLQQNNITIKTQLIKHNEPYNIHAFYVHLVKGLGKAKRHF